jgi:PTH1 family peptidyl-tRNA hydrolase
MMCTLDRIEPPLRLAKPMTYMNRSGIAVAAMTEALAIPPEELLVVVDDIDLPVGRLRLRPSGGAGSHNGLRDIVAAIGTSFPRLRIGVRGEAPWDDLADYVLAPFTSDEEQQVVAVIERAAEAVLAAVNLGLAPAMNQFNRAAVDEDEPE